MTALEFMERFADNEEYIEEIDDYESFDSLFDRTIKEVRQYLNRM